MSGLSETWAYDLPVLPPIPTVSSAPANSMPMGDPADFPEVQMDFNIETNGPFEPDWNSISSNVPGNGTPAWLREAKFGIWFHFGPQANLESADWSAQHMYQQGSWVYNNHLANFGHPTTNGYKDVINAWDPNQYDPAALAQLFHDAGARFVLVQGVHHDNFDNWNSTYNPWNIVNFGAQRDTMTEWKSALTNLNMHMGVAFHHEYSWWFTQPDFLSDSSGPLAGVPYDAVTATNSAGTWWENFDTRMLYNQDVHKYQGISTPNQGYWNPTSGIFTNDLDYCHWYATQWALRMIDVVEQYDPDFIYTDGNSTQPFDGYMTSTGYKCDAMQRVIAHYYNRTLERHGQLDTLAVVKFHNGDNIGTTYEGNYSSSIKSDQPWFAELSYGPWFYEPNINYDTGGTVVHRLLEAVSRDGAMMVNIPNRPDGSLENGAISMLEDVGQWMAMNGEGIYGSRAWAVATEGDFRFTVGSNGCLYAYYLNVPSAGTTLNISSLATSAGYLLGDISSVSMLGSAETLSWSQTASGLEVTCPSAMPTIPSGTAIAFKIGPASVVGGPIPTGLTVTPSTNQMRLSWYCPTAAATYNVKRSTDGGATYTTIASNLVDMAYVDTAVSAGTLYSYVVSATDGAGESADSTPVSAALAAAPSNVWLTQDIGDVGATGSFSESGGTFTINGSGADIWGNADEFRYVFQALQGDQSLTARVLSMDNTDGWAKAGIMMRDTLSPDSKYVIHFLSPVNGVALQQRSSTGGSASGVTDSGGVAAPYWIRLERAGNVFTAYRSDNGADWSLLGSTSVAMSSQYYVGLAVSSHNDGTLNESIFDHVSFTNETISVPVNSKITWESPVTVTNNLDILHSGTLVHAGNFRSDNQSVSVSVGSGTVLFENRQAQNSLGDLSAGEEARLIQGAGGRQVNSGLFDAAGTSVDVNFESVLDGSAWENGDPGPAPGATDMILRLAGANGDPLVEGARYQIQLFYSDDRYPTRSQVYHDNTSGYSPSAVAVAGDSTAAVGTFTAGGNGYQDVYIQNYSGGANYPVALNAYVLQLASGPDTNPTNVMFSVAGGGVLDFAWPAGHTGWRLESNSVGLTASNEWYTVPGSDTTNQMLLDISSSDSSVFYRLVYP